MKTVLIVDDHEGARRRIRSVVLEAFQDTNIEEVATLAAAREQFAAQDFDLTVLDLNLPDGYGDDFIVEILEMQPNTHIVVSTIHDDSDRLVKAIENGAKGYLLKEQPKDTLVTEFRGILDGRPALAPTMTRRLLELMRSKSLTSQPSLEPPASPQSSAQEPLTERQLEVLKLLAKGFNRPEIGGFLNISKHTVATHIGDIYTKLDVSSRSEAALEAYKRGLL